MKTKKSNHLVLILLILAGLGLFFYVKQAKKTSTLSQEVNSNRLSNIQAENNQNKNEEINTKTTSPTSENPTSPAPPVTKTDLGQGTYSNGSEMEEPAPDILVVEVIHDGVKFLPAKTTIKVGDVVIFKNNSLVDIWPATEPKDSYVEFNSGKAIAPGKTWNFKFTKSGTWKFKDTLNTAVSGTIIVQK